MADLSTIRIPVDSEQINSAVSKIRSLELQFRNLVRQTEVGSSQYKRGLLEIKRSYQELGVSSQKASAEIERYSKSVIRSAQEEARAKKEKEDAAKAQRNLNLLLKSASDLMKQDEQILRRRTMEQKALNAELARQEAAYEQVKQAIDPLYAAQQRYDRQLEIINRKHAQASSSAEALKADIDALNLSFARAGMPIGEMGQITGVMGTRANTLGMVLQQTGYQVGDFAVQVQSGTNAFVAFGQQATQLAGLLYLIPGGIGVIAGTIASIGIPSITALLGYFSRAGKSAEDAAEAFEGVSDALSRLEQIRLDDLGSGFAESARQAREQFEAILGIMEEVELRNLEGSLRAPIQSLMDQMAAYEYQRNIAARMGQEDPEVDILGLDNYQQVIDAVRILNGLQGDTREELQQQLNLIQIYLQGSGLLTEEAKSLLAALSEQVGLVETLNDEAQARAEIEANIQEILRRASEEAGGLTRELTSAKDAMSLLAAMEPSEGWLSGAISAASTLAANLWSAASANSTLANQRLANAYGLYAFTRGMAPEFPPTPEFNGPNPPNRPPLLGEPVPPTFGGPRPPNRPFELGLTDLTPSGGGSSGGGAAQVEEDRLQTLIERITKEQELLTLTEAQKEVVQALGDQYGNYSAEQIAQVEAQIEAYNRLVEAQKQQEEILNTVDTAMTDAFMSMVSGAKSAEEAFADMARSIISKLYEMLVVQQIVNAAMGFLQGPTAMLTGAPTVAGARASGGSVMPGSTYLVGENGPELIVPRHSGTVVNATNTRGSLGGSETVVVNNNISVTGSDAAMVRNEITKMIPQITEASKAAVINARQRGGQMRATFGG